MIPSINPWGGCADIDELVKKTSEALCAAHIAPAPIPDHPDPRYAIRACFDCQGKAHVVTVTVIEPLIRDLMHEQSDWSRAQVIKIKISDRYSTILLRDDITGGFRAADGSLHTVESIIESGNQVTVIEP